MKKNPKKNCPKAPVKIILVGVPKAVMRLIGIFHTRKFVKAGNWITVKENSEELMVTITLRLKV